MGFNLIQAQIGKVLEAELSGSNFRFGDPIPEVIKDWFDEDDLYLYFSTECVAEGQRNNRSQFLQEAAAKCAHYTEPRRG